MKKSTKKLTCCITVIAIVVAVWIGILTGKAEEVPIGIDILNSIEINKGTTERIEYNLRNNKVTIEATSSDKEILEINEIQDRRIVITGKEKGNATIKVQASYKGESNEKLITVMITEENASQEIVIENWQNITNKENKIYIKNCEERSRFTIKIRRSEMSLEETEMKVTFDREIEQEIKGNKVEIFPKENCRMVIEIWTKTVKTQKEYEIIVEKSCSTFLLT